MIIRVLAKYHEFALVLVGGSECKFFKLFTCLLEGSEFNFSIS